MKEAVIFSVSLIVPFIFWRVLYRQRPEYFDHPILRRSTGLKIHHRHQGLLLLLTASLLILFGQNRLLVIVFLGLGLGMMLDEVLAEWFMPSNRAAELKIYEGTLRATIWIFLILVTAVLLLGYGL